jgi:Beta-lactamase enzyme family
MCHVYKALWREAQSANYFSAFWGASGPRCLPYKLNASDDSGGELHKAEGQKRTLTGLVRADDHCKQQPCNEPADRKAWRGKYSRDSARIWRGWDNNVVGGVEDNKANEMGAILHWQKFNEGIPAGLPEGTPVAHKTGEITKTHHAAAIVFAKPPFILAILVRGLAEKKYSAPLMAALARSFTKL